MKQFFKIFFISLPAFAIIVAAILIIFIKNHSFEGEYNEFWAKNNSNAVGKITESGRINVLVAGLESTRTDTIMLASYDKASKKASVISIPRDTHYSRSDMMYTGSNKINSINSVKGIDGLKSKAEEILGIPIHNFVTIDYDGVKAAVDAIGGVEVNVPFRMKYDDPRATPPLHIDFQPGIQTLYGDDAIKFLRFRKGNYGYEGYTEGDIGRIQAQQDFVKSAAKKIIGPGLPDAVSAIFPYVNTDFTLAEALSLAMNMVGMDTGNIAFYTLPGNSGPKNGLSFYFYDEAGIKQMIDEIYNLQSPESQP